MARAVGASCEIDAPVDVVWSVLTDVASYPSWNPFTVDVKTTFELGTPVEMQVVLFPWWKRKQVEYVSGFHPKHELSWAVTMGAPWLVTADRYQRLTDLGGGRTRYETADVFTGAGVPVVFALMGRAMKRGFEGVAAGLKARSESLVRPPGAAT